jgi:hypothetical protein
VRRIAACVLGTVVLGGIVLVAASVVADSPVPVHVVYSAAGGCPSEASFVNQLRTRTARVRPVADDGRALVLLVRAGRAGARFVGSLALRGSDGTETHREIEAATCDEVVSGLALIAAVAVDPAILAPTNPPAAIAGSDAAMSEASANPGAEDSAAASETAADAGPANEAARSEVRSEIASTPSAAWHFGAGAGVGVFDAPAPTLLLVVPLFAVVDAPADDWFSPSARLRVERGAWSLGSTPSQPTVAIALTSGSLDLCPVAVRVAPLRFEPCVRVQGGALDVSGLNVTPSRTSTRLWLAAGAVARARWLTWGRLSLEGEMAAVAPLIRDRFYTEPATTVYRPPVLGWAASAGAGVFFW